MAGLRVRSTLAVASVLLAGLGTGSSATAAGPQLPGGSATDDAASDRPVMTKFGWRAVLNFYRATAGVAPVKVNRSWSKGARLHSRYMVKNRTITHWEDPKRPHYTHEGYAAGANGNVTLAIGMSEPSSTRELIERWMTAPFHAAGMIDAALRRTGFGAYREKVDSGGHIGEGATLDVLRGRSGRSDDVIVWPAEGMQVPVKVYPGGEWPNPLTSCPGYKPDTGLPIIASFPSDVRVKSSSFSTGNRALEHCAFDAHSYRNPKSADRRHARAVLASRNTVVLIPRAPLEDFHRYTASLTMTGGRTVRWSFTIGEVQPPTNARVQGAVISRAFQERTSFSVGWTATDRQSGIATYDVRWRRASLNGKLGAHELWQNDTSASSATFSAEPGYTYCFSVRAVDRAGNRSPWGKERCTTMPMRPTQLDADPIWVPVIAGDHYARMASMQLTQGATLRTGKVKAKRLALIVSRGPMNGTVDVLWNGRRLARIDLETSTLRNRDQIDVASFRRVRTGRVTIRVVTANRPVIIEGVGVGRI